MTPHRGPSRQRHRRDGPVAAAAGPVGGIPATPCGPRRASAGRASPVTDSPGPTAPAWWPPAHVVRSPPARAPAHGAARAAWSRPCPPACPPRRPRRAWARSGGRCACGRGRRPLRHPGAAHLAGRHPGRPADLPFGLAARHLPATLRYPRHVARAMPARARQAVPACGSRPSRTAQPPRRAPVAGREPPSRKDDGGGATVGTTGMASGFLTRVNEGHSRGADK